MRAPHSTRCPRCGFSFAWNGRKCGHCPPPSRARQLWEQIDRIPELVGSDKNIPPPALLAVASGCLRRVWDLLPENARELLRQLEADPAGVRRPRLLRWRGADALQNAARAVEQLEAALRAGRGVIQARTVHAVAEMCGRAVGYKAFPDRDLLTFPLPPELEPHRAEVAAAMRRDDSEPGVPAIADREEDDPVRVAFAHLSQELAEYNQLRWRVGVIGEAFAQCEIARDVLGYPEVTVTFDPAWRTDTAVAMAREMLASRDFSAMPILADALQDAGCEEPEILEHCRAERPHFPGCWVLGRILGEHG